MMRALLALSILALTTTAHAQATRTWISGVGDDANPCSRTAPCKTIAGAFPKTAANGEINFIDPAGVGGGTLTKSMIIDGRSTHAGVLMNIGSAFTINAGDTDVVVLRGLDIFGAGGGTNGIRVLNAKAVFVEDCVIAGFTGAGIKIEPTAGKPGISVLVKNTIFRTNGKNVDASTVTTVPLSVTISESALFDAQVGIDVANATTVNVSRSVISGSSTAAIRTIDTASVSVDSSLIANNVVGIFSGSTVRISEVMTSHNNVGLMGPVSSFGNNRIAAGNGTDGAPTSVIPQQ